MARFLQLLILILSVGMAGCALEGECEGTVSGTYTLGVDPTADFSVANAGFSGKILSSSCGLLPQGKTRSQTLSNISRVGDQLVLEDRGDQIFAAISGSGVGEHSRTQNVAGCDVTVTLVGTLNPEEGTITTQGAFAATGVTCDSPF